MSISLVVPVFNEESAVPVFYHAVKNCPGLAGETLELLSWSRKIGQVGKVYSTG